MIGEYIELSNGIEVGVFTSVFNNDDVGIRGNISKYKACIISNNKEFCTVEGKIGKNNYDSVVNYCGKVYSIKSFGQNNTISQIGALVDFVGDVINGENAVSNIMPHIYDNKGNLIGHCELLFGGSGLNKFSYVKYIINNVVLFAYELSPDSTDILYCIYNDKMQMVATISRAITVVNGHARYTIYSCNEEWFKYVSFVTICWSLKHNREDGDPGSIVKHSTTTVIPELLEKYNPTFINQVKQKVGFNNLPENMNLVSEKVSQAKKGLDVKLPKFVLLIVFITIFILMLIGFLG